MTRVSNSLTSRLGDYLRLIEVLCECYDRGDEIVALSIATAIRVLVHDTASSTSLLSHLHLKYHKFVSTNLENQVERIHFGLVRRINVGVRDGKGGEAKYWPLCDERYFPVASEHFRKLGFDSWWEECVFKNSLYALTRKDLVLAVTNKDGGAHFDASVDEKYDQFRRSSSGGRGLIGRQSGTRRGFDNIPTYPAIRQIAYELLHSDIECQI